MATPKKNQWDYYITDSGNVIYWNGSNWTTGGVIGTPRANIVTGKQIGRAHV